MIQELQAKFIDLYSVTPRMFRSPGRINIIGEHTDYNDGFVLPAAIDKEIVFAVAPNTTGTFRFYAADLNDFGEFPDIVPQTDKKWANYLLGVVAQMQKKGFSVPSVDVVFGGNVPLGAGLSSSAALECGFAFALNAIFDFGFSTIDLVKMSQLTEHEFVGLRCGIMDQFAVMFGKKDSVVRLDCRSLEYQHFPFILNDYAIVLCNSNVKHELASSEYNVRRHEGEEGVRVLSSHYPEIRSLRDATLEQLECCKSELSEKSYMRCKYVIEENQRVLTACEAMLRGDVEMVGKMMYATHEGMSKLYEASCKEIDEMVDIARTSSAVVGSRIMGGGFGGCTISVVKKSAVEDFKQMMNEQYYKRYNTPSVIYDIVVSDGTNEIML